MAKSTARAKRAAQMQTATTPETRTMKPHELLLSPTIHCAVGIQPWGKFAGDVDLNAMIDDLRVRVRQVQDGDMRPVEAMLYGQAMTLETIFTNLVRRAANQEYLKQFQTHLALALKAQAQCRVTLEALAEIKNPRQVVIANQVKANINNGQQQINNGMAPVASAVSTETGPVRAGAHARQPTSQQNGLLEDLPHGNELDAGTARTAGSTDSGLEAMGAGHRTTYA